MNTVTVKNVVIGNGIPKICVPIVATTKDAILAEAKNLLDESVDMIEWRVDWFEQVGDMLKVKEVLGELAHILKDIPFLFTFRTVKEGGAKDFSIHQYIDLLKEIIATKLIDLIDIEVFTGDEYVKEVIDLAHQHDIKVVASNHDFHKTLQKEEIINRLCKMQELGADISKIAVMPKSRLDVLTLLEATTIMSEKYADRPIITMSMDRIGGISRMTGELFGSAVTFASAKTASAPGQIPIKKLREILQSFHESIID